MRGKPKPEPLLTPAEVATMFRIEGASKSFANRVFAKVDASGDCWEWTRATNKGYGVIGRGGRDVGLMQAHRAVYELLVGPIPPGMQYDHLCRNPGCVNPDHGEIVTAAENKRRGYGPAILHSRRDLCPKGHPKDGMTGGRGSPRIHRYCKTCARANANLQHAKKAS